MVSSLMQTKEFTRDNLGDCFVAAPSRYWHQPISLTHTCGFSMRKDWIEFSLPRIDRSSCNQIILNSAFEMVSQSSHSKCTLQSPL